MHVHAWLWTSLSHPTKALSIGFSFSSSHWNIVSVWKTCKACFGFENKLSSFSTAIRNSKPYHKARFWLNWLRSDLGCLLLYLTLTGTSFLHLSRCSVISDLDFTNAYLMLGWKSTLWKEAHIRFNSEDQLCITVTELKTSNPIYTFIYPLGWNCGWGDWICFKGVKDLR